MTLSTRHFATCDRCKHEEQVDSAHTPPEGWYRMNMWAVSERDDTADQLLLCPGCVKSHNIWWNNPDVVNGRDVMKPAPPELSFDEDQIARDLWNGPFRHMTAGWSFNSEIPKISKAVADILSSRSSRRG